MKNIQVIDDAINCVYDIFGATEAEFGIIFPHGTDIAFIDEVFDREDEGRLHQALNEIWKRRIPKKEVQGIHGVLFYGNEDKKEFYPDRTDEGARNPDGSRLRAE